MELVTETLTGNLNEQVDAQIKKEPSRLVRIALVNFKLFLMLSLCLMMLIKAASDVLSSDHLMSQIYKLIDLYINSTSPAATCKNHNKED